VHNDVWRDIRALRAVPAGEAARDPERAAIFRAALRQAEELADAARAAGYASSALPLFYSLEQAAQAVDKARRPDGAKAARGHGLKFVPSGDGDSVLRAAITPSGYGAFQSICVATGSSPLAGTTEIGALWAANPDLRSVPIPAAFGVWHRPIDQLIGVRTTLDENGNVQDPETPITTSGLIEFSVDVPGTTLREVESALLAYPTLREARGVIPGPVGPIFGNPEDHALRGPYGTKNVRRATVGVPAPRQMTLGGYQRLQDQLFSVVEVEPTYPMYPYPHLIGFALPKLGGGPAPTPLLLWWALLLGLSSLVRYYPAQWVKAIDRDLSELAVHLETVLDVAAERMPARLLDALTDLT
jgi:hypothetical protein